MRRLFAAVSVVALAVAMGAPSLAQDGADGKIAAQIEEMQKEQAEMLRKLKSLEEQLAKLKEQQARREAAAKKAPAPVTAGFGKIQFDGLMQQWLVGADGGGAASTARIRRMELKFAGEVRPNVRWTVMVDPAKSLSVNTTSVNGTTVATGVNQSSNILQDAFITYVAGPHLSVDVGQEKVPISMEGLRSSSQLLTIERSIMNTLPTNSGRMGDIRDTGIQVRGSYPQVEYTVAVMNDTGPRQNDVDNNNRKDAMYRLVYRGLRSAQIGFGGTLLTDSVGASKTPRKRFGADLSFNRGAHTFEFEYGRALDLSAGSSVRAEGANWLYAFRLTPRLQLVGKVDTWDPNLGAPRDREWDYTLGANWYLAGNNAKIQINLVRKDIQSSAPSFLGPARTLYMAGFQTAW